MKCSSVISVVTVIYDAHPLPDFLDDVIPVVEDCSQTYEIIVIANGLSETELASAKNEIRKHPRLRLMVLAGDYSTDLAYVAGIETCIGDYIIVMDSDRDPAPVIADMLKTATEGYDVVVAASGVKRYGNPLMKILGDFYFKAVRLVLGRGIVIDPSYFTCFSRKAITALTQYKDSVRNYRFLRSMIGLPCRHIPYVPIRRTLRCRRPCTLRRVFLGLESFFSYSLIPLKFLSAFSFLLGVISFGYSGYALLSWFFRQHIERGWTSTAVVSGAMFGSLFFILGTLGQYLAILLKEGRKFPLYIVSEDIDRGTLFVAFDQKNVVESGEEKERVKDNGRAKIAAN